MTVSPIDLLFGGMAKLSPGDDAETRHILHRLSQRSYRVVVDAGCGAGRQTLVLAQELHTVIQAVDSYEPFLNELGRRAQEANLEHLVQTHCLDMRNIPAAFQNIDLLWSEGAAYNIGFANALATWAAALVPGGIAAVSELSWLAERRPQAARDFFGTCYPQMRTVEDNVALAESANYQVLFTHPLPAQAWVEGYYDTLAPRAARLREHSDAAVRDLAAETLREIEVFAHSEGSYGYVFYVLKRA